MDVYEALMKHYNSWREVDLCVTLVESVCPQPDVRVSERSAVDVIGLTYVHDEGLSPWPCMCNRAALACTLYLRHVSSYN